MKFGPLPGQRPYFRLTVATIRLSVSELPAVSCCGSAVAAVLSLARRLRWAAHPRSFPTQRHAIPLLLLQAIFEAHPREWTDPNPAYLYAEQSDTPQLRPFMRAQASNVLLDLGLMDEGDTFMKVCSTSVDVQDLRLAYR